MAELADPVGLAELEDQGDPAARAGSVDRAVLGDPAELVGLVNLVGPGELAGLAGLANLSGSTDQSTEEMHPTQIKGRQTSLAVGLRGSPHAELLIGPLPELVLAAEPAPVGPEKEVESPVVHLVQRRFAPVAGLAPGHPLAQLPVVARTA